ncbi:lytic transglycosylase domain-containing protein [Pelomonas sp. APW6]|uniref:Lytic transglycosylase domain-containing protein n=1 Tax=Roseateles subflavus TaxID=3053353 RepID=A0ABT7LNA0_9BURK|nr:lytic transglycosylase domain-containing protein [Pelomonas sp. APW6]MDL5034358.1 lytic transglycosylase domain-containing protein [Pelomonas sp. APW6]
MIPVDFLILAQQCAPNVHPVTMAAIVHVESGLNPYAIGVVGGRLERQPRNSAEALATIRELIKNGWNFSVGAAQINRYQLERRGVSYESALDACTSLRVGGVILSECYGRALTGARDPQVALQQSFSCYYSGNLTRGFASDSPGGSSYVQRVLASASRINRTAIIPAVRATNTQEAQP